MPEKTKSQGTVQLMWGILHNPHIWIISLIMTFLVLVHYHELFTGSGVLDGIGSALGFGLTRNTVTRILFLIPIIYGTVIFGLGAGISLLALMTAAMLPRVFVISPATREALFETIAVIVVGALIVFLLYAWQESRRRMNSLENAKNQLNLHVKRLSVLHTISTLINQPLGLNPVKDKAMSSIAELIGCPVVWLDVREVSGDVRLFARHGISKELWNAVIKPGQGQIGKAAQQLSPLMLEDTTLLSSNITGETIKSILIIPLITEGKIIGSLGIGFYTAHHYPQDEIDLLTAIADQFGMAIENANLYHKERTAAEELRVSEKNYRDIFENASDAIWVHDLTGTLLAVNGALCRLTGYEADALIGHVVTMLSPEFDLSQDSKEAHNMALKGETPRTYEQKLVKKDGTIVILQIATSLTSRDGGQPVFQHVARDITEEKRTQENLRLYAQKAIQAQEAERKRIARELHDETVQALVVVSRHLYNLASGNSKLSALDLQEEIQKIANGVRLYSQELRPSILDDLGLLPSLEWLASDLTDHHNIETVMEINGNKRPIPPEIELTCFRIAQEAMANVRKHSQATRAWIKVTFSEHSLRIIIQDNGKGFEVPKRLDDLARSGQLGLAGMQERAQLVGGNLSINVQPGQGTGLTVEIPV